MSDAKLRRYAPYLLFGAALLLLLPGLGAVGFWEPYEIRVADAARAIPAGGYTLSLPLGKPPMLVWAVAKGFSWLGVTESGGRLPIALSSLFTVLGLFYAGASLVGRRAALWGGLVLATSVGFLIGGRQIVSASPSLLAMVFAWGGLWRALGPAQASVILRSIHLAIAVAAMTVGVLASGFLLGVGAPLLAVALALPATRAHFTVKLAAPLFAVAALGLFTLFCFKYTLDWSGFHPAKLDLSVLLGGPVHPSSHTMVFTQHLVKVGVGLFPWVALVPIAVVAAFAPRTTDTSDEATRVRRSAELHPYREGDGAVPHDQRRPKDPDQEQDGAGFVLIAWLVATWITGVVQAALVVDLWPLSVLPLALLVGRYLDTVADDGAPQPFAALAILLTGLMVTHDIFAQPDLLVGNHLLETVRWPGTLGVVGGILLGLGILFSLAATVAVGVPAPYWATTPALRLQVRRRMLLVTGAVALLTSMTVLAYVVPSVSKNLSVRDVYGKAKQLDPNAPLGQYRFGGTGSSYYLNGRTPTDLRNVNELFDFLGKSERVFVMVGSTELAAIDQHARESQKTYYLIDDSNNRFAVLSNQLGQGESDKNPLRRSVSSTAPKPRALADADFEGKIQLLGYDMPSEVERGQDFKVKLYFQVKQPVGAAYKIFMHFDSPGARFHGDHAPVGGLLPTNNWPVGTYVTDEYTVVPDKVQQPPAAYRLFVGFWAGDTRLKTTGGRSDGENRVQLGGITVR